METCGSTAICERLLPTEREGAAASRLFLRLLFFHLLLLCLIFGVPRTEDDKEQPAQHEQGGDYSKNPFEEASGHSSLIAFERLHARWCPAVEPPASDKVLEGDADNKGYPAQGEIRLCHSF